MIDLIKYFLKDIILIIIPLTIAIVLLSICVIDLINNILPNKYIVLITFATVAYLYFIAKRIEKGDYAK